MLAGGLGGTLETGWTLNYLRCRRGQPPDADVQSLPVAHGSFWSKAGAVWRRPDATMKHVKFQRLSCAAEPYAIAALLFAAAPTQAGKRNEQVQLVSTVRVPNGGIQPQIAIDD